MRTWHVFPDRLYLPTSDPFPMAGAVPDVIHTGVYAVQGSSMINQAESTRRVSWFGVLNHACCPSAGEGRAASRSVESAYEYTGS
jgi:hypothetical protein